MCVCSASLGSTAFQQHTVTVESDLNDGRDDDAKLEVGRHTDVNWLPGWYAI